MQLSQAFRMGLALLFGIVVVVQCANHGRTSRDRSSDLGPNEQRVDVGCDPDLRDACPDDFFICANDDYGGKRCTTGNPATPDEAGNWVCEEISTMLVCHGAAEEHPDLDTGSGEGDDIVPGENGGWVCVEDEETGIVCRRHAYYPGLDTESEWNCEYEAEFRVCDASDGGGNTPAGDAGADADADSGVDGDSGVPGDSTNGDCPPGIEIPTTEICGDGIDNNCNGRTDENCTPPGTDCVCRPGAWRFCDTPDYCLWGKQYCDEDAMAWGPCEEINSIPSQCLSVSTWYSPQAEACCINEAGGCCQDMWDLDFDGNFTESLGDCVEVECVPS